MSITYLKRAEIDTLKWERCVNADLARTVVFAQHWFLDNYCKSWDAVVVDDYRAVLPLPVRKKFGISYVYPPCFATRLGFFGEELTQTEIDKVLDLVAKKFKWADLVFNSDISYKKETVFSHRTYLLDLNADYDILQKKYHESHKRNCKKGQAENLKLVSDADPKAIINLFKNNRGKDASVGYRERDYDDLLNIITLLQERRAVEVAGVCDAEGVLQAGAFFTFWGEKYQFLFSGRDSSMQSRSLYFLIDNFILRHAGENRQLDFNGSNNANIARFYAGFGAKETTFKQLIINRLDIIQRTALFIKRKK